MAWTVTTQPTESLLTLEELKAQLRVDFTEDDSYIQSLHDPAMAVIESKTWRAICTQTITMKLDAFPASDTILLPKPPLQSVTHVKYLDGNGDQKQLTENTDFKIDTIAEPGRIYLPNGKSWPGTYEETNAVEIVFIAGYSPLEGPRVEKAKHAMKLIVAFWYANREEPTSGKETPISIAAKNLLLSMAIR